jgi:lyso-ornithine lipid O-acyltransferase
MIGRLALAGLVLLPFTIVFLPVQWIMARFALPGWPVLPGIFFRLGSRCLDLRVTVYGRPAPGPALLLINHISWLDIFALAVATSTRFVAKSEVASYRFVGFFAALNRTLFIDRTRRRDVARASSAIGSALGAGDRVLVFAEGTSGMGTHVLPFRSALVAAAIDGDAVVIQPVAIAYRAICRLPISQNQRSRLAWVGDMALGDNLADIIGSGPKDVAIAFGTPYPATGDRKVLTQRAEDEVRAMLAALNRGKALPSP